MSRTPAAHDWLRAGPDLAEKMVNVRFLFHGADKATLELICREGFDSRVANLNGLLGAGNYFAYASSYSHDYSKNVRANRPSSHVSKRELDCQFTVDPASALCTGPPLA